MQDLFLPEGYPDSVSNDYLNYQIWDTLQGFMGYMRNIILTMAHLKGMGVGANSIESTLVGAMYVNIVRDTTGVISGLIVGMPALTKIFSDRKYVKRWRMLSEILRILSGFVEIYAAYYSTGTKFILLQTVIVSLATCASVISVQVRSSLITHFARKNNISDCAAKEGNQDRGVKVFGIPLAILLISNISNNIYIIWTSYLLITALQLLFNLLAMHALII